MRIVFIGLMLFALFFGAGNLIFPTHNGQLAGVNFGMASLGFVSTGVLLPLFGVLALIISGEKDLLHLSGRAGRAFGLFFTTALFLTIGPLFAMPRTATVSYEIFLKPMNIPDVNVLLIFSAIFFIISFFLALNQNKIVDIVGKILTPLLLIFISILILFCLFSPVNELGAPLKGYKENPFFSGFIDGYQTMDALASLVFAVIVISAVKNLGVKNKKDVLVMAIKASLIAAVLLGIVYISLFYLGATSSSLVDPNTDNGGGLLFHTSYYYFDKFGTVLLGLIVTLACLTTNIGLTNALANYFNGFFPKMGYFFFVTLFTLIAFSFANFGLSNILLFSLPVLFILYPLAVVLIALTFLNPLFKGSKIVYTFSLYGTLIVSLILTMVLFGNNADFLSAISSSFSPPALFINLDAFLNQYLPLYGLQLGWLVPTVVIGLLGYLISLKSNNDGSKPEAINAN